MTAVIGPSGLRGVSKWTCITALAGTVLAMSATLSAQTVVDLDEARLLAFKLVADGQYDAAAELARTLLQSDPEDQAALLALAQAERGAGRTTAAISAAKAAWRASDTQPEKYASAIVAAQALSTDGRQLRAQFWLRRAAQRAPNDAFKARAKRDYRYVQSVNPVQLDLRFSVTPSSNINNGSKSDTVEVAGLPFTLVGDALALSGIEYRAGATLSYKLPPVQTWNLLASATLDTRFYTLSSEAKALAPTVTASDYAFQELDLRLRGQRVDADGQGATWVSGKIGQNWYGGSALTRFAGVDVGRQIRVGKRANLSFQLGGERQWRQDSDLRSADVFSTSATWTQNLQNGSRVWLTGYASDTSSQSAAIAQETMGLSLRYAPSKPVFGNANLELSLGYETKRFDRAQLPFARRLDDTVTAAATLVLNDLDYFGFAPTAQINARTTNSTLGQFDSNDFGLKLGLRSTF